MGRHHVDAATAAEPDRMVHTAPILLAREVFSRFGSFTRPDRPWLAGAAVLLVLAAGCDVVAVWMFSAIVDDALGAEGLAAFWAPASIWVGVGLLGAALVFAGKWLSAWVAERFVLRLRDSVFGHLQRLPPDFFEQRRLGDLVARLTGDIDDIQQLVSTGVLDTTVSLLSLVFFAAAAFYLQWDLAVSIMAMMVLLWLLTRRFARVAKRVSRDERASSGAISAVVEESLANTALVQAYTAEGTEARKLHTQGTQNRIARLATARLSAAYTPLTDLLETLGILTVLGIGAIYIANQDLTVGGLLGFAAYLGFLYPPLKNLGQLTFIVTSATASSERLAELLDTQPRVTDTPRGRREPAVHGQLRIDRVDFGYPGTDRQVLSDLSLTADPGELLLITGASGAGKSSVAKLLLRFYDPTGGRITLDGVDLREYSLPALRASITLLLQETLLVDGSIAENISFGSPAATDRDVRAAAAVAGADEFIAAMPGGYATRVGQRGRRLSGGQRQRLAIARAIVRNAPLLVLDEPTTGLDGPAAEEVLHPLRRLMRTRTTILITHDLRSAADADRILVLAQGHLVEQGTHAELLAAAGHYSRLHASQAATSPRPSLPLASIPQLRVGLDPESRF